MTENMPPEMMVICHSCGGEKVDYDQTISEPCEECKGMGDIEEIPCPVCDGKGCPRCFEEGYLYNVLCPICEGMGEMESHPKCLPCGGTGWHPHPDFWDKV